MRIHSHIRSIKGMSHHSSLPSARCRDAFTSLNTGFDVFRLSWDSVFPDYYEMILSPMDFSTLRENLNDYSSVETVLTDLRQIWENCRIYNEDTSEIVGWATELETATELLIEVRLPLDAILLHI
jgi:Bromodomain